MRKHKELQGLSVVDVSEGRKLGSVRDLVISPDSGRILALLIGGGMLSNNGSWVAAEDVRAIGPDAITVERGDMARPDADMPDELRQARDASRGLIGTTVVTENGAVLGSVKDYLVDERLMRVAGLSIGGGLLSGEDALAADRVISVGPDAVMVASDESGDTATAGGETEGRRRPWAGG